MLQDISYRFSFRTWTQGNLTFKEASGELGMPGHVVTHRSVLAQRALSGGTGEHAGHLIGIQFGAPGDDRNLGLQNANMNTFAPKSLQEMFRGPGGSYHDFESRWSARLKQGHRIVATVRDRYRLRENRPFSRYVQWAETSPSGISEQRSLEFGNFSSRQMRAAGQRS